MRALVVYFSRKGYVRKIAEQKAAALGADIFGLETSEPTRGKLAFWWCGRFGMHRWGMPLISLPDASKYEHIVVCSPIWVFDVCAPVREFLKKSAGRIKSVEYVLVHFSFQPRFTRAVRRLDITTGATRARYESVVCVWGRVLYRRVFK